MESVNEKIKKKYQCKFPECNASFVRPFRLQDHMNIHLDERPHKCTFEECDKSYTSSSHLKRHLETHKNIAKAYTCRHCSANISTLSNLKRHYKRAHGTDRELVCKECDLKFRKKRRYEEHMASHNNSSLFECDKCGRSFLTHMKLTKHQLNHISRNHKCPVENCPQVFDKWCALQKHKKNDHTLEYPCTECGKVFRVKAYLELHRRIHSEDRPSIPCPYTKCNRLYYFKRNLDQHIRNKHIGKKFHCDLCDLRLSTKQKIEEHMIRIHLSEKKSFKRKAPAPRKDAGLARKSVLSQLTGIQLGVRAEVHLMQRPAIALLRDKAVEESSFSEDDRASDVSAKGA